MSRIICAGHVNWDRTLRVDRLPEADDEARIESETAGGGGSAGNVATALARLGVAAGLLGSVGGDDRGRAAREELIDAGVDCSHLQTVPDGRTTVKHLLVDAAGETALLGRPGANEAFTAGHLSDEALDRADHVHLTGQNPTTAARLLRRATDAGVATSFDPGRRVGDRAYGAALDRADVVFLNDREAAAALGEGLDPDGRTLVLKHGPRGAEVRTDESRRTHPGFAVEAVDATGAGDAFAAGFVAVRVAGGGLDRALATANACGALATTTAGARADLDPAAVRRLLDRDGAVDANADAIGDADDASDPEACGGDAERGASGADAE